MKCKYASDFNTTKVCAQALKGKGLLLVTMPQVDYTSLWTRS